MPKIFRRGKTYYVRGRYKGVELYRSLGVEEEGQAYIEVGRLLEYIRGGGDVSVKKMTVAEACEVFLKRGRGQRKESTWLQMRGKIAGFCTFLGGVLIDDLIVDRDGKIILDYIDGRRKAGMKDPSILQGIIYLSSVIKAIKPDYKLTSNRVLGLQPQQAKLNYLSEDEFLQIVPLLDRRYRPFICLARYTGLRISDCFGLRWSQIDRDDLVISVKTLKTGKAVRSPIPRQLIPIINELWSERALGDDRVFRGGTWRGFSNRVRIAFKKACQKIGKEGLRFHDLRHSFCTSLAKAGIGITIIADMVGHATSKTTEKYIHFNDSDRKRTSERVFGGGKRK